MDRLPSPALFALGLTTKVAESFRRVLLYTALLYSLAFGLLMLAILSQVSNSLSSDAESFLGLMVLGGVVGAILFQALSSVYVYKCTSAMGSVGLLWVAVMFLPCLNLIGLLFLGRRVKVFLVRKSVEANE